MNISRRLMFLLLASGVTSALTVGTFAWATRDAMNRSDEVATTATRQLDENYALLESVVEVQSDVQTFIRLKDPDEMEKLLAEVHQDQKAASEMIARISDGSELKQKWEALVQAEQAVMDETMRGNVAGAYEMFFGQAAAHEAALLATLKQHNQQVIQAARTLMDNHRTATHRSAFWRTGIVAAGLLVLIIFGWRLKNHIVRELTSISRSIADATGQLFSSANQVSTTSQSLAEGSSEQAASIEETSASIEQLSSMTKHNAGNAQKANDLARQTRSAADQGALDMANMSEAMEAIKTSSGDIAKIIKTIDEIAFQTNILALNAAVEAARAGEAGMGFAVVADEVRNLAQRSAQAAKETSAKIEGAITVTSKGVDISAMVAKTLSEIVEKARQLDELAAEVAGASREQTQGIGQINSAIGQMDKVTQSNAASAEESAAAAQELNAQAKIMRETVTTLVALVGVKTENSQASQKNGRDDMKANSVSGNFSAAKPSKKSSATKPVHAGANKRDEIPLEATFRDF